MFLFSFFFCCMALAASSAMSGLAKGAVLRRYDPMQHSKKGSDSAVFVCSMLCYASAFTVSPSACCVCLSPLQG